MLKISNRITVPKILHINTVADPFNSVGGIMRSIVNNVSDDDWELRIACGRGNMDGVDYDIGSKWSVVSHYVWSRFNDSEGFHSTMQTKRFLSELDAWNPDLVHLHNLHGHYINVPLLMEWLKRKHLPVVVTLHDCWWLTGHCSFYSHRDCSPSDGCRLCRYFKSEYLKSMLCNSAKNYEQRRSMLRLIDRLALVAPSRWMAGEAISAGFEGKVSVINHGINLNDFVPHKKKRRGVVAVAARWEPRKGLDAINAFADSGLCDEPLTVVGELMGQRLHPSITHIPKLESHKELCEIYNQAIAYINPSKVETFGLSTVEAMACDTPVIVNADGALDEVCGEKGGIVTNLDEPASIAAAIAEIKTNLNRFSPRVEASKYCQSSMSTGYKDLYCSLLDL